MFTARIRERWEKQSSASTSWTPGARHLAVTWCWICNTGVVFKAESKGQVLHFDLEGLEGLVGANEIFKDRETVS